jgi:hypothetical protein
VAAVAAAAAAARKSLKVALSQLRSTHAGEMKAAKEQAWTTEVCTAVVVFFSVFAINIRCVFLVYVHLLTHPRGEHKGSKRISMADGG